MGDVDAARGLADRLRALRTDSSMTQAQLALALGASGGSISAWENGKTVPPENWLTAYALLFASPRVRSQGGSPDESQLTDSEAAEYRRLLDELTKRRDEALQQEGSVGPRAGALGGRFWHFPDDAPVRIITTKMWPDALEKIPYSNPRHPNYIESLWDADRDATIELFGHIRAENPTSDVRFLTADQVTRDDFVNHVVLLGQGDSLLSRDLPARGSSDLMAYMNSRLKLPVGTRLRPGGDPELDSEFVVLLDENGLPAWSEAGTEAANESFAPRFSDDSYLRVPEDETPVLLSDVALLARRPNQENLARSVTICSGVFSRGTFGAVRALTDIGLRAGNERFLEGYFGSLDDFWLLFSVAVAPGKDCLETLTPDLSHPNNRLRSSAQAR